MREVAALLASAMGRARLGPEIAGQARAGDIRHCIADIAKARQELGFAPKRDFAQGLAELAEWVARQEAEDRVHEARKELELTRARGMTAASAPARPALVGRRPVLVTGGAGFIGSNLADRLAREGHDVLVYDALARPGRRGQSRLAQGPPPAADIERRSATSATSAASPPRRGTPRRCSTSRRRSR